MLEKAIIHNLKIIIDAYFISCTERKIQADQDLNANRKILMFLEVKIL